ncbi:MAG TPA: PRC-barrel domain-containing protein [Longimicrobiales bacterium]|nr:PRC-barrel domain-containing protein [Longimicrobiales bacterium]
MREPLHATTDLHGLPVYDAAEVPIGLTVGVLADADTGLVRFFDIELDNHKHHVLVPVGHTRVEPHLGKLRVRLRAANVQDLESIPAYEPHVAWSDDAFQNDLLDAFGRLFQGQRYYAHPAYDHSGLYAGTHPLLKEALDPPPPSGLKRLSCARQFRVAQGEPDIRGWNVLGESGAHLGTVTDLIIDGEANQVRYVIVRRETDDAEVAIPVGYVNLGSDDVSVSLSSDELFKLPVFAGDTLEREYEVELRALIDRRLLLR